MPHRSSGSGGPAWQRRGPMGERGPLPGPRGAGGGKQAGAGSGGRGADGEGVGHRPSGASPGQQQHQQQASGGRGRGAEPGGVRRLKRGTLSHRAGVGRTAWAWTCGNEGGRESFRVAEDPLAVTVSITLSGKECIFCALHKKFVCSEGRFRGFLASYFQTLFTSPHAISV